MTAKSCLEVVTLTEPVALSAVALLQAPPHYSEHVIAPNTQLHVFWSTLISLFAATPYVGADPKKSIVGVCTVNILIHKIGSQGEIINLRIIDA